MVKRQELVIDQESLVGGWVMDEEETLLEEQVERVIQDSDVLMGVDLQLVIMRVDEDSDVVGILDDGLLVVGGDHRTVMMLHIYTPILIVDHHRLVFSDQHLVALLVCPPQALHLLHLHHFVVLYSPHSP